MKQAFIKQFIYFIITGFMFGNSNETHLLERYIYTAQVKNLKIGKSTLEIFEKKINNKIVHEIHTETSTKKIMDIIYKIRDTITLTVDPKDYSLLKVIKKIHQGKHKDSYIIDINYESLKMYYNQEEVSIPGKVYDPLSIIFNLRRQKFEDVKVFNFTSCSKNELKNIQVELIGMESIKSPYGVFECHVFAPTQDINEKSSSGGLKIWFSNDDRRLPIKIEKQSRRGVLILLLENYETNE